MTEDPVDLLAWRDRLPTPQGPRLRCQCCGAQHAEKAPRRRPACCHEPHGMTTQVWLAQYCPPPPDGCGKCPRHCRCEDRHV